MILLDQKTNSSDNKPLNLSYKKDEKPSSSFSQLLKGVSEKDALVLALDSDETAEISLVEDKDKKNFSTLLKNTSITELKQDSKKENKNTLAINEKLEINPQITNNISPKDLKVLISDAKKYLKDKILQSDNYKIAQTKELPKTLKGLVKVAKTFGIDVSKISLEEVKSQKSNSNIEIEVDAKIDLKSKTKPEVKTETKAEIKPQTQELKTQEVKAEIKSEVKAEIKPQKEELKAQEVKADVKHTPLFKAQTNQIVTTEQALQARELKITDPLNSLRKTPKERADETLKLLLRGEKAQVVDSPIKLTADFSVATAKVIAPSAMTEVQKSLESLLKGDSNEGHTSKVDGLNVAKADSFEVKLNEAKQMTKYLSHDIKQAID
ncbi:MAG: flagellar hook-length control protein FliK, partial [Thiovulaceae bacterium]|nr:flagellar hook-length control protein FliK [Sulfurimonadaceae bacterium]